ncbi:hypothetical protein [Microcoleus sp. Pol7_B1]|uniref:hypothetical protein n=1 Tax=Microcoleus sp. Pol7_B1 TaxID=2818894 RepID=UPI002FCEA10B
MVVPKASNNWYKYLFTFIKLKTKLSYIKINSKAIATTDGKSGEATDIHRFVKVQKLTVTLAR